MILKRAIAFILLFAFAASTFSRVFVVADYYTNTAAYAINCVNKAKPAMRCNGKCQMMKRLQQQENKDQQNPERKMESKGGTDLSSRSFFVHLSSPSFEMTKADYSPCDEGATAQFSSTIFHPPGC